MSQKSKRYIINIIFIIFSSILIWPAIYNGFPLVYSDSGTYMLAGFTEIVPVDRPIFYCLFVRLISLSYSLWLVLIAQALIISFVIYMIVKRFSKRNTAIVSSIIIFLLSITTGLSNYTSQIMPDIFSSLTIIGLAILFTSDTIHWKEYLLSLFVIFAAMVSFSNLILLLGTLIVALFFVIFRFLTLKKFLRGVYIAIFSFFLILTFNKFYTNKFILSRASNIFIIARMIETGVVSEYLKANCINHNYLLCNKINELPPYTYIFLFDEKSPLYDTTCLKTNWSYCWEEKNKEFGRLIYDIIKSPKYMTKLTTIYFIDFFKQLIDFKVGSLGPMRTNSPPQYAISENFKEVLNAYKNAKQYQVTQDFKLISLIQLFVVIISLIFIIFLFIWNKKFNLKKEHILISTFLFVGILGNALTVSVFGTIADRFQARVIWIIPLMALLLVYRYFVENKQISIKINYNKTLNL